VCAVGEELALSMAPTAVPSDPMPLDDGWLLPAGAPAGSVVVSTAGYLAAADT